MIKTAVFSPCGLYRYALTRRWAQGPRICFIMLNPSNATDLIDDPTVRKDIRFGTSWGFGSLVVVNLFAYRSTSPAVLDQVLDPVGPENDVAIADAVAVSDLVVAAWGVNVARPRIAEYQRPAKVRAIVEGLGKELHVIRLTKHGHPEHPLFLPGSLRPFPMNNPAVALV